MHLLGLNPYASKSKVTKKYPSLCKTRVKAMRGVELFNNRGQPGCDLREKAQNENFQCHGKSEGNNTLDNISHGAIRTNTLQNKQVHAYGRSNQCQLQIEQHNNVEPNGIEAYTANQRENNRQGNENDGNRFQNSAQEQQQNINGNEYELFVIRNANYGLSQSLRRFQNRQDETK